MSPPENTVRTEPKAPQNQGQKRVERLVFAFHCDNVCHHPMAWDISAVERLEIGRGDALELVWTDAKAARLSVPDSRMSRQHALLQREANGRVLKDCGSTNGSHVNGDPVSEESVVPGARLRTGRSLFIYQHQQTASPRTPELPAGTPQGFLTLSPRYAAALSPLMDVSSTQLPVLLLGETGTGKEVLARSVHESSARPGAFVAVNCGALSPTLADAQLFGHTRGAFSGAVRDEPGFVMSANNGTLFLDEIGDLPAASQTLLLRVLEERQVTPVGSTQSRTVNLRVIAATHRKLEEMVQAGSFRRDLYARLAGYTHQLAPLRERREDVALIFSAWHQRRATQGDIPTPKGIEPELAERLLSHDWPMNVRELVLGLERASILAKGEAMSLEHWQDGLGHATIPSDSPPPPDALSESEQALRDDLVQQLKENQGNIAAVGRNMGKARQQIQRWLKRFQLRAEDYK